MRKSSGLSTVFLSLVLFLGFIPPLSGICAGDRQTTKTEIVTADRASASHAVSYYGSHEKYETNFRNEYHFILKWYATVIKISLCENRRSLLTIQNQTTQQYLSIPYRNNDSHLIILHRG